MSPGGSLLRAGTEPGPAERGSFLPWQRPRGVAYMTRAPKANRRRGAAGGRRVGERPKDKKKEKKKEKVYTCSMV